MIQNVGAFTRNTKFALLPLWGKSVSTIIMVPYFRHCFPVGQVHKEHLDRTLVKYYFECATDMIEGHAFVYLVDHHYKLS